MRADERFRIGSVTKTFVAALVLLLVEDGKLRLDDTVESRPRADSERRGDHGASAARTPPACPTTSKIRACSGIPAGGGVRETSSRSRSRIPPGDRHQEAVSPTRAPTTSCSACSQRRSATRRKLLQDRIFEPLDLYQTSFTPGRLNDEHVHGHRPPSHQGVVTGPPPTRATRRHGGPGERAESCPLRRTCSNSSWHCYAGGSSSPQACARWSRSCRRAGSGTASGLPRSRPPAGARGDIRERPGHDRGGLEHA